MFDGARFEALDAFLRQPGPEAVPEPEHLERYEQTVATAVGDAEPRVGARPSSTWPTGWGSNRRTPS